MQFIIDYLFPHLCLCCMCIVQSYGLCVSCYDKIQYIENGCIWCGHISHTEHFCIGQNKHFTYHQSCVVYKTVIKKLIMQYKSQNDRIICKFFASLIVRKIKLSNIENLDYITAVPLHWMRLLKRGFNQVQSIVNIIAHTLNLNILLMKRLKNNASQRGKDYNARQENVKNIFQLDKDLCGKNVVLIDDVYTTGATINSCAYELKCKGAGNIYAFTIAKVIYDT